MALIKLKCYHPLILRRRGCRAVSYHSPSVHFFFSPFDVDTKNRGHFLPPALWPRDITGIKHKLSWPRPFSSSDFKHKLSHGSLSLSLSLSAAREPLDTSDHHVLTIFEEALGTLGWIFTTGLALPFNPFSRKSCEIQCGMNDAESVVKKFIAGICQKSTDVSRKKTWRKRGEP